MKAETQKHQRHGTEHNRHGEFARRRISAQAIRQRPADHHADAANQHENCGSNAGTARSEEHTSELQSLMRISYAVFCLKKKREKHTKYHVTKYNYDKQHNSYTI